MNAFSKPLMLIHEFAQFLSAFQDLGGNPRSVFFEAELTRDKMREAAGGVNYTNLALEVQMALSDQGLSSGLFSLRRQGNGTLVRASLWNLYAMPGLRFMGACPRFPHG